MLGCVVLCGVDRSTCFFFTRCVNALPAADFIAFDDFGSLRIFAAFEATVVLVVSFEGLMPQCLGSCLGVE